MRKAKDIMTLNPACCLTDSTVMDAINLMKRMDCGAVPVINNEGQCVGIVTDRDICMRVVAEQKNPLKTPLQEVMTHKPVTCHPDDRLEDVLHKKEKHQLRRILVVDQVNQCIGIISEADITRAVQERRSSTDWVVPFARY